MAREGGSGRGQAGEMEPGPGRGREGARRRGLPGAARGRWGAALLLLLAPACAGGQEGSEGPEDGEALRRAGGSESFPAERDVALMEMFVRRGGILSGFVYSKKEVGEDALLSHEPERGLFAKDDFNDQRGSAAHVTVPVNVTISVEAAKASPVFRLLEPVFAHNELWGLTLYAAWVAVHDPTSAIGLQFPNFLSDNSGAAPEFPEPELNGTFIEAFLHVQAESVGGFLEVVRGYCKKYPLLFPAAKFTPEAMSGAYSTLRQRAVRCGVSRSGDSGATIAPEASTVAHIPEHMAVISPMLDLVAYNSKKSGRCDFRCDGSGGDCSFEFSASMEKGEEASWDWGGLTDAEVFSKFGDVPVEPNPSNKIHLGVPMSEDTKTRDAQKKLLALCGDDESFVLDADGVSPALLCATRVAASGSSDLEDAAGDWNPAKPLSEVNERKALASLEETLEIILNSYPTSDIEDEALLGTLKGRQAAMVRMRLNEKLLIVNAMNSVAHYSHFTLPKLAYLRVSPSGYPDAEDEL